MFGMISTLHRALEEPNLRLRRQSEWEARGRRELPVERPEAGAPRASKP